MAQSSPFKIDAALLSDIGMKRKQNQDAALIRDDLGLYMVADGMGGHKGGETASRICIEKVAEHLEINIDVDSESDTVLLHQALLVANQAIYDEGRHKQELQGMGTTATIIRINGDLANILQVGDSRAYYWNEHGVWQLTRDHSLVQEKLRAGLITREQTKTDSMKNVITRSVGVDASVKVDLFSFIVAKGDGFLICSDGLSGPVSESLMFDILEETMTSGLSLNDAASKLVHAANSNGGDDNVTVVLVRIN
jgi:serine/threonine protein phosphatase PrpC